MNVPEDKVDPRLVPPQGQIKPYKFTLDELRVIKECNKESFFQRCIPISTVLGIGTYYGVNSGFLKPNAKLGASPKVILAVVVGYFIGKISYQGKCAEKLMQLPNSQIGEMLRQKRRGNLQESFDSSFGAGISLAPFSSVNSNETYSDIGTAPNSVYNLDTNRPTFEGLDESLRPSIDNPIYEEEMPPAQKHITTYEELRKQNREEYQQKRIGNYPKESLVQKVNSTQQQHEQPSFKSKNKYGDDME